MTAKLSRDYVTTLLELAESRGMSPILLSQQAQLDIARQEYVSVFQLELLLQALQPTLNLSALGLEVGVPQRSHGHGYLGYAAKSCDTLLDAIILDEQFIQSRVSHVDLVNTFEGEQCHITLHVGEQWLSCQMFIAQLVFSSFISFYQAVFDGRQFSARVAMSSPQPSHMPLTNKFGRIEWQFGQPTNCISCHIGFLSKPLPTRDDQLRSLAEKQCQDSLQDLHNDSLAEQVRKQLLVQLNPPAKLADIAAQLGFHERTLKRRLKQEGASYQQILIQLRCHQAQKLLTQTQLSIADIAFELGYANPSTFKRLFKQWTGIPPGQVRKQAKVSMSGSSQGQTTRQ